MNNREELIFNKLDFTCESDPYEVEYLRYEGSTNIYWNPELVRAQQRAIKKVKELYPEHYYHRGLHSAKPNEFIGITVYLRDREPTAEESALTKLEGFPFKIKGLGDPMNTLLSDEVTA
jgi:hypothetical protein